jgi:hypothetical protein
LQPAPTGAKARTDSTYKRGHIGEQVILDELKKLNPKDESGRRKRKHTTNS